MEQLLATLGLLFALFLVLAAAVEAILEMFRGLLERIGITWLKGKSSLDDALKLAAELAPTSEYLATKLSAIEGAAKQAEKFHSSKIAEFGTLKSDLVGATSQADVDKIAATMNDLATSVKVKLESDERARVWILKLLSATLGIVFASQTDFHVFQIIAKSGGDLISLAGLQDDWLNRIVGGIAAAAGSNYWHDQLDRVRSVKASFARAKSLIGSNA
ncbi:MULTISPECIES: hypothetical protein [Methylomonas]|uniref:Uncharacterized protein n=2 Tax=Methylomonas TaxID=416 RepID=A0A140E5D3_9GAMM|nr:MULTISPECIES: hypothetical protein [Methylomonas]AMK75607.1 hypothetical protein JT25_003750 [Methylomonas denitrificans]OAI08870.1 hypothetical protein A1342_08485 [Methylomonas methanica]TCV73859.1 hypothetical protein EDE11_14311 [Methylomonas methanica]